MDINAAKVVLANLRERIEPGADGRHRLEGIITKRELEAFDFLLGNAPGSVSISPALSPEIENPAHPIVVPPRVEPVPESSFEPIPFEEVTVDLSTLDLPESDTSYRVCLDFGTAMSKATFVHDNDVADFEEIHVLRLGIPGDQEEVNEVMLLSSIFVDPEGRIWFGHHAVEQEHASSEGGGMRLDNIKRWLSEGNLSTPVDAIYNPTTYEITYEDLVLAYLTFFTWTVNRALAEDVPEKDVRRNFYRRFAMPCFPRANAKQVEQKLNTLLGEAQILADTFWDDIHNGLPLGRFLSAVEQLRAGRHGYPFIGGSITEPLGVAGSMLSWRTDADSLALVVDIGAGTSDFSLYRLHVTVDDEGEVVKAKTAAFEVDSSAKGITEAGNHLDNILKALILNRVGITPAHPKFNNISYRIERNIRTHKEDLFNTGSVFVVLDTGETVDIKLDEFLNHDAVKAFENSLRQTMIEILESVNPDFIDWVRMDAKRRLTIVLTGGGATLPMARKLASGDVMINGSSITVAEAQAFPTWLKQDYPDLESPYPRIAVSLGGARKNVILPKGVARSTGTGIVHTLERFQTKGI
ncbi:hypothetical protein MUU75_13445 [Pseudoxanthomonas mexicana]|uniref:hypothetical protein n=1 Tax=Pseudoxanthomonas mexicana TaxID=128785 RepID=UPI001FD661FB|nr:hypothetical protein [Pseudoxanthomonas mexicana]UOV04137.1 hypothetical protein MUU75_13445 [Pseudoxanthomonas mexicana]